MAIIFSDDFETGDFSAWDVDDSAPNTFNDVVGAAALEGSWGVRLVGGCFGCTEDTMQGLSVPTTFYRMAFRFDRNTFSIASGEEMEEILLINGDPGGEIIMNVAFGNVGGTMRVTVNHDSDDSSNNEITWDPPAGNNHLELRVERATNATSNDGVFQLFVNGSQEGEITGIDNFNNMNDASIAEFWLNPSQSASGGTGSVYLDDIVLRDDDVPITSPTASHLWLSTNGMTGPFTRIDDSTTWGASLVGKPVLVPGTAGQTFFAMVGSSLYKTINQGSTWTLETAVGYEAKIVDLEKDNTTVILANRASGGNRASLWDGSVLTHINTGKSTTGGATDGGDVV